MYLTEPTTGKFYFQMRIEPSFLRYLRNIYQRVSMQLLGTPEQPLSSLSKGEV